MTPLQLRAAKIVGCTIPTLNQNKAFSLYFSNPNTDLTLTANFLKES
jgi:hypothetical protein